jgi:hypothetical protein
MVSAIDDVRLVDLFNPDQSPLQWAYTDNLSLRIQAVTLLAEATKLRQPGPAAYKPNKASQNYPAYPSRPQGQTVLSSYLRSDPEGFKRVKAALDRFCEHLPTAHRPPWEKWDEGEWSGVMPRLRAKRDSCVLVS